MNFAFPGMLWGKPGTTVNGLECLCSLMEWERNSQMFGNGVLADGNLFLAFFSLLLPGDSELLLPLESEPECLLLSLVAFFLLSCLESCLMTLTDIEPLLQKVLSLSRFLFNRSS